MKCQISCVLLLLATVFVSASCIFIDPPHNNIAQHEIQQEAIDGDRVVSKKLLDLDDDVLQILFCQMEIGAIFNLLEAYPIPVFFSMAKYSFRRRFLSIVVEIDGSRGPDMILFNKDSKNIRVPNDLALKFLGIFGEYIQNVAIAKASPEVLEYIDNNMRESLIRFDIIIIKESPFQFFKRPFPQLQTFSLKTPSTIKTENLSLSELFPKLEELDLWPLSEVDASSVACNLPNLEHIKLRLDFVKNKETLLGLFRENRKLHTFHYVGDLPQSFCNAINDHLQNLESLTTYGFLVQRNIRIDHIKHLTAKIGLENIDKTVFPVLESIDFFNNYLDLTSDECVHFLQNHQHVTHLKLHRIGGLIQKTLTAVRTHLPNLAEITLYWFVEAIDDELISGILEQNSTLMKLNILDCFSSEINIDRLRERVENHHWNITVCYEADDTEKINLSFERKGI